MDEVGRQSYFDHRCFGQICDWRGECVGSDRDLFIGAVEAGDKHAILYRDLGSALRCGPA